MTPPARPDPVAARHSEDGHGGCVICLEYVPHTDDEMVRVPWPCLPSKVEAGYVLVNADMLAAAIGSLPSPPSVLHPEESAAAILAALESQP